MVEKALESSTSIPNRANEQPQTCKDRPNTSTLLDVHLLDDYLVQLLLPKLTSLFQDGGAALKQLQWLALPLLRISSLLYSEGQTPATKIIGLKCTPVGKINNLDDSSWRLRLVVYAVLSTVLPLAYESIVSRWLENSQRVAIDNETEERAFARKKAVHKFIGRTVKMARLACLLACWAELSSTSSLAMLISRLKFQRSSANNNHQTPQLHVDYAHRRWLHQEAMLAGRVVFAGLWMTGAWKPLIQDWITRPLSRLRARLFPFNAAGTRCAICKSDPIMVPFQTSCGHLYCYTCLFDEAVQTNMVYCRVCSEVIRRARPLTR